ncbi:Protein prenyltransferase, alpha subunit [Kalmanozyma brasiliensis GHG001]|uniref:Protein farnesyltransferase/geranylgeranyltransferase type-1 subunit alpha n=1 Tax=Kalmanozyma brasiliensis (strain GHG001) TaxID=1365824 RepID=V5EVZ7_KALBG|nr:Protein prenyltransferase, alpha subunit [Kalmanozyma brasiliensis GHG001]EST07468.1 Protein prenyltransferase, alpha subunit [Kalmanozyma brasiliensis GHG001]
MTAATASSTTLDDLCSAYLPFDASSSAWSDLTPTPQLESSSPMCPILFAPEYSSAMDLYRTLTVSNTAPLSAIELSPRALALTSHLIQLNPSHFSVWQYRANIILHSPTLGSNRDELLRAELGWLDELAHKNMKSYQVWQHRRLVVSALGDPGRELEFVKENLARDAKNYHTWGYRQWVLAHFGGLSLPSSAVVVGSRGAGEFPQLWDGEADYVDQLLSEDVRNNSAWNHRWYIHFARFGLTGSTNPVNLDPTTMEKIQKTIKYEKAYAKASLAGCPNNASAWTYLRALHTALPASLQTRLVGELGWVKTMVSTNAEAEKDASVDVMGRGPVGALEWWFDCLAEDARSGNVAIEEAEMLVKRLIVADSVRKRFWAYRLKSLRRTLQPQQH